MEEDIRKKGMLYFQHQRFGKKWKRVWCVLYRESSCSISRLEFFECKDGGTAEKNDKSLRKQQEHKKVIRLADCIRVTEVDTESCPRDTGPFLIETTEKIYMFAAERHQLDDWTRKLCEIAFPMNWTERSMKRGSLHRGHRVDEDEGMEDNSLYSGRETVRDFRVCIRRTEASDRCRLKGDGILRPGAEALQLLDKTGDVMFSWPYRFLRRFGRDKTTFSFEAGRRCDSGEGSFEFDTKQGNVLFQAVEAAINMQRLSVPHRQTSGGGGSQVSPESPQILSLPPTPPLIQNRTPPPLLRSHGPQSSAAQAADCVYSMVTEPPHLQMIHHKDKESSVCSQPAQQQQQQRPPLSRLETPLDKTLTGVKSLTLETRVTPAPRKNQVKTISSCPLPEPGAGANNAPHPRLSPNRSSSPDQAYSEISLLTSQRSTKKDKRGGAGGGGGCGTPPVINPEPEYSLPFDTIAKNVMADILNSQQAHGADSGGDPLYDSIDEMKIRNIFSSTTARGPDYSKVDHIYDEPEGCAATAATIAAAAAAAAANLIPPSVYDDPEEMRGDAWRVMGTTADPKGHEYPYNPRVDDYAVPKRAQRAFLTAQSTNEEDEGEEVEEEVEDVGEEPAEGEERRRDSPYNNVMVKMA